MIPLVFVCLAVGMAFGIREFLQTDAEGDPTDSDQLTQESGANSADGEDRDSFDALTRTKLPGGSDVDPSDVVLIGPDDTSNVEAVSHSIDEGIAALELLELFLGMENLDERFPHIETKSSKEELESSVLNESLPEVLNITVDVRETNSIEQVVDFYYHVDFKGEDGNVDPQTMLVRKRGDQAPKVVVDPFLDLFGGRFENFTTEPSRTSGTFQVIVTAGAFCYDDIPESEKKYTLKILSREDTKAIAKAYFGKQSKIGRMLEDETSGFAYGQSKACTVFMRWNIDDNPARPFLEALDIKALNWNP
ncbi:MAG: hypothetical protein AB8D78_10775 [Akkermansiaceae bacterium]